MSRLSVRRILLLLVSCTALLASLAVPAVKADPDVPHPQPLCCMGFTYVEAFDRVMLYGGKDFDGATRDETWAYNVNSNSWQLMDTGTQGLGARGSIRMTDDPLWGTGLAVMFGAGDDTWTFDGSDWTECVSCSNGQTREPHIGGPVL